MAEKDDDLVREAKNFFSEREGAESENREHMVADLRFAFIPGAQWDEAAKVKRAGRPMYSYNRVAGAINQLIGDQRMTQPSCKVRAVNKAASVQVAEMFGGLIRDIEAQSDADTVYAEQFKYAVAGAWGAWRVVPEYEDGETFDQVLRIKRIPNPMTVYFDEQADPFGRGSMRCVVAERISIDKYRALYGEKTYTNLPVSRDGKGWHSSTEVRIAEYYRRGCDTKTIALLSDGRVMDYSRALDAELKQMSEELGTEVRILRKRKVQHWYVEWAKIDGTHVLEGPVRYDYKVIPVIRLPGRHINIEGEQHFQSLHRHAKDAQRTYNYDRSSMVETTALTPRAPYIGTAKQFAGYEQEWSRANTSNSPFLRFNIDPDYPQGRPERAMGPEVPQAYMALAAHDAEDIRQTTGYFNPALDQQTAAGDAESGRALRTRLMTADSGSYEFLDNFAKAVQYTWHVMICMIPVHYDTARTVRLLGMDGREQFADLDPDVLKKGKFDVTVTLGPVYATARMEAVEGMMEAAEAMPIIKELAPDIIVRNLDVQGVDEVEKRVRLHLIRAGIVAPTEQDQQMLAEFPQQEPDPVQEQLARRLAAQALRDETTAQKTAVETESAVAGAQAATRRELLELRQLFESVRKEQAETALLLKELRAPLPSGPQ